MSTCTNRWSVRMILIAVLVMMSMLFEGFMPAAGINYDADNPDQEQEEESEYFWNDGYYRAFLDDEDGEHLVGVNVPFEGIYSMRGFSLGSNYVMLSFITGEQDDDDHVYASVYLYRTEPQDWSRTAESERAGSFGTRYDDAEIYTCVDYENEVPKYRNEYAGLTVNGNDIYAKARYYPTNQYGARAETTDESDYEYRGILENFIGQILAPVEAFSFEMPETEKSEIEIDPEKYDAVLAVRRDGEPVPVLGLLLPDDVDMQYSQKAEESVYDNVYDYITVRSYMCSIQITNIGTNLGPAYRYFEKDTPFAQSAGRVVKELQLIDEVLTGSGKLTIYRVIYTEDATYDEIALISNNGVDMLISLNGQASIDNYDGDHIRDFFDVVGEETVNTGSKETDEDVDHFWNDGYYRGFLDNESGEHLIGLNVPSEDVCGVEGFEQKKNSVSIDFMTFDPDKNYYSMIWVDFYRTKPDDWDNTADMELAGTAATRYGDMAVYTETREEGPDWTYRYEYGQLNVNGNDIYARAEYHLVDEHRVTVSADNVYQGILEQYIGQLLRPVESFSFEAPEIEKTEIEINPEDFDAVLAIKHRNELKPVLGLLLPYGTNTQYARLVEDNIYERFYASSPMWSLELINLSDSPSFLYRYFEKDTPFVSESWPAVEEVELLDEVMTTSGKLYAYKVIYKEENDYDEIGLMSNNGADILIMLNGQVTEENYTGPHIVDFFDVADESADNEEMAEADTAENSEEGYYMFHMRDDKGLDRFRFNIPEEYRIIELNIFGTGSTMEYRIELCNESGIYEMRVKPGPVNLRDCTLEEQATVETVYGDITVYSYIYDYNNFPGETAVIPIDERSIVTVYGYDLDMRTLYEIYPVGSAAYLGILEDLLPAMLLPADEDTSFAFDEAFPEDTASEVDAESYEYIIGSNESDGFGLNISAYNWTETENMTDSNGKYYVLTLQDTDDQYRQININAYVPKAYASSADVLTEYGYYFLDDSQFAAFITDELSEGLSLISVTEEESLETDFGTIAFYYVEKEAEDGSTFEEELGLLLNNGVYTVFRYNEITAGNDGAHHYKESDGEYDGLLKEALNEMMTAS